MEDRTVEIAPGVVGKTRTEHTDLQEVLADHAKIAAQKIEAGRQRENRIAAILASVERRIANLDGPIRITDEMVELGIADRVWAMVQQGESMAPIMRALRDSEDESGEPEDQKAWPSPSSWTQEPW